MKQVGSDGIISLANPRHGRQRAIDEHVPGTPAHVGASRYDPYIQQAATIYQIPEALVRAVINVESGFEARAVSKADARGLMQLLPSTAARMMVDDIFDPRQNIFGGVRYLRVLANLFNGDLLLTLAAYNAGPDAVVKHGGIPPYAETRAYVAKVVAQYRQNRERL
jgi:soluble lytic murein transglycosylase-like protein